MNASVSFDLIPIQQDISGFAPFFGAWLCRGPLTMIVDVGPARTAHRLIEALRAEGVRHIDYVLLTHIHIDHCGALADLLETYPAAKVVCHDKGLPFLINPEKLWTGSVAVLGKLAEAYGPPRPLAPDALVSHKEAGIEGLTVVETPGHAVHHLSFLYGGRMFAGEAAGNFFRVSGNDYLRPATPPRFFLDVCLESVDRLLSFEDQPICYAHYGSNEHSKPWLTAFREQLLRWAAVIEAEFKQSGDHVVDRCIEKLLLEDPLLSAFKQMDADTRAREKIFMGNAVNGFLGYLSSQPGS